MKEVKNKMCANDGCENEFRPFKTTDKYCRDCAYKKVKPLKRTPLKKVSSLKISKGYIGKSKKKHLKTYKPNPFEVEFSKAKVKVKERVIEEYGRLCCERCATTKSIQFSTHHIIYRTEKPKNPSLNDQLNLIYLCFDCHEWFHKKKTNRNPYIKSRKLYEIFDKIWGYNE